MFSIFYISTPLLSLDRILEESMFSIFLKGALLRRLSPPESRQKAARRPPEGRETPTPLSLDTSKARDLEESMLSIFYISTPLLSLDRILEESMFSIFLARGTTPLTKGCKAAIQCSSHRTIEFRELGGSGGSL